jgi:hypothetical protein
MGRYNTAVLQSCRHGFLGIYLEDLQVLKRSEVPIGFETHAAMLREALPFFSSKERPRIEKVLEAGALQAQYIRASDVVNALKDGGQSRKKVIDDFLFEMGE